jgi:hypothetical protein
MSSSEPHSGSAPDRIGEREFCAVLPDVAQRRNTNRTKADGPEAVTPSSAARSKRGLISDSRGSACRH